MKTLYIECAMGAAGDMLMAALCELIPDPDAFIGRMNALGLPGVRFARETARRHGIAGTRIAVTVDGREETGHHHAHNHHDHHGHAHSAVSDIRGIIDKLPLPDSVKARAAEVYDMIAEAEAAVHGMPVSQIHLHEVGALDAVADVCGVCLLMDMLKPDRVVVSPIHVGSGTVRCAHGVLPVPAPATARLLEGLPVYGGDIQGELCTPTGAALLRRFADGFGPMPAMTLQAVGCGMGSKDFERPNCLRAMLGETDAAPTGGDDVCELCCNLDDMTGEALAFAADRLMEAGALDAWTEPILMKKGRPAAKLCCLCQPEDEPRFAALMLRHTSSLGVRCQTLRRHTLSREEVTLESPWGPVRAKRSQGFGVERVKPECDDLAAIARREGLSLEEVRRDINDK